MKKPYSSLYPSILREFNMSPNSQLGKIKLPYKVHDKEGHIPSENFNFNRSREFSEDLTSKDWLEFASRWLHLATYDELLDDIEEHFLLKSTKSKQQQNLRVEFEKIAQKYLFIDTLKTQNSDSLDFHDVSVWGVEAALKAAYELGRKHK